MTCRCNPYNSSISKKMSNNNKQIEKTFNFSRFLMKNILLFLCLEFPSTTFWPFTTRTWNACQIFWENIYQQHPISNIDCHYLLILSTNTNTNRGIAMFTAPRVITTSHLHSAPDSPGLLASKSSSHRRPIPRYKNHTASCDRLFILLQTLPWIISRKNNVTSL